MPRNTVKAAISKKSQPAKNSKKERVLVVGLGNPGGEYEHTYHNLGFLAINFAADALLPHHDTWTKEPKLKGEYLVAETLVFLKPLTFMNKSGESVRQALRKFKISKERVVVIHDESDLTAGEMKLSYNRGAGGHRGIQSIIDMLGDKKFWRIRIGIRPKKEVVRSRAESLVLKRITTSDQKIYRLLFQEVAQVIVTVTENEKAP